MIHPLPIDLLFKPNIYDDDAFLYIVSREVKTGNLIGKKEAGSTAKDSITVRRDF